MLEVTENRGNWALRVGLSLALAGLLCNGFFFAGLPGQNAISWLSIALALAALVFAAAGLKRALQRPKRAKILGSIVALVSLLLAGVAMFAFVEARSIPAATGAPSVGQKAPDFTLTDTNGQAVSLAQLFAPASSTPQAAAPKAVLLIFYRGYW
jgi:hypothetical protein